MAQDTHNKKFQRRSVVVCLEERWYIVEFCQCGRIHTYEPLSGDPGYLIPKIEPNRLPEEIKDHIISRSTRPDKMREMVDAVAK